MFTYGRIGSVLSVSASVKSVGTLVIIDWPTAESATNKILRFQAIKPRNFNQQCFAVLLNHVPIALLCTARVFYTVRVWYGYLYHMSIATILLLLFTSSTSI